MEPGMVRAATVSMDYHLGLVMKVAELVEKESVSNALRFQISQLCNVAIGEARRIRRSTQIALYGELGALLGKMPPIHDDD